MNIYALICQVVITVITLLIIYTAKPNKRYGRLLICAVLIPVCLFILHRTCFFNTVPHCNSCLLVKAPVDANDLKSYCMFAYFILQTILTAIIVKKDVKQGEKFQAAISILLIMFLLGVPVAVIKYM